MIPPTPAMIAASRARLDDVHGRIAAACSRAGRSADDVTLVAVTKGVDPQWVAAAALAGQRHFAENRVVDGLARMKAVEEILDQVPPRSPGSASLSSQPGSSGEPPLTWHFIGHLQTNKARDVVGRFDRVDSVDSLRLAAKLNDEALRQSRPLDVLLEINLLPGTDRTGFEEAELVAVASAITRLPGLSVRGLMAIAPNSDDERTLRAAFERVLAVQGRLREVLPEPAGEVLSETAEPAGANRWGTLSMGMSGDYELAVECGATEVRLGRTLFGA